MSDETHLSPEHTAPCPLCGSPAPAGALHERLLQLAQRQDEVLGKVEASQRKGWWDRTPIVVAVAAFLFTSVYQVNELIDRRADERRAQATQRLELMAKFFPYLTSADPAAQRGAVLAIDMLADSTLAAAAVLVAPSPAAASALHDVRMNPVAIDDPGYVGSVIRRLPPMRPVTRPAGESVPQPESAAAATP